MSCAVTASLGLAYYPADDVESAAELVHSADGALALTPLGRQGNEGALTRLAHKIFGGGHGRFPRVDGKGNFFFPPVTQTANGVFSHPTATGTYTVSPNCLFTLDVLVVDGATSSRTHREGVVVDGGNEVWATVANIPTSSTAGVAQFKKISRHGNDDSGHHEDA